MTMPGPSKEKVKERAAEHIGNLADQDANSTNSEVRYMAYASRFRTALRAAHRYIAYVCVSIPDLFFSSITLMVPCRWRST